MFLSYHCSFRAERRLEAESEKVKEMGARGKDETVFTTLVRFQNVLHMRS